MFCGEQVCDLFWGWEYVVTQIHGQVWLKGLTVRDNEIII